MNPTEPLTPTAAQLVHVGRQPIFDRAGKVVAYELLFRGSAEAVDASQRDTYATSQVMLNAFTEFGVGEVVGDRLCFVNLTREFLVGALPLPFSPSRLVLEVLETVEIDDEVCEGVDRLAAAGYRIALDDFVWGLGHERLLSRASYVKLDFLDPSLDLERTVAACRQYPDVRLVAEKVETDEHLALADRLGFELRQGYALSRPQTLTAARLSPSRARRFELLGVLMQPDADLDGIVTVIASDAALALRVLRASNSAATGTGSRVSSIRQAVVLLGVTHVRQLAMIMVLSDALGAPDDRMAGVLARARLAASVAAVMHVPADEAFTAGLLTGAASLIGLSFDAITQQLPLAPDVADAVRQRSGPLGRVLRLVDAYECGDLVEVAACGFGGGDLSRASLEAMRWSTTVLR